MKRISIIILAVSLLMTGCANVQAVPAEKPEAVTVEAECTAPQTTLITTTAEHTTASASATASEPAEEPRVFEPMTLSVKPDRNRYDYFLPIRLSGLENIAEEVFPSPRHIAMAKEHCWQDEGVQEQIKVSHAEAQADRIYPRSADQIKLEQAISHDFDSDGTDESIIVLAVPASDRMVTAMIYYCDDDITLLSTSGPEPVIQLVECGSYTFFSLYTTAGVSSCSHGIWSCSAGEPKRTLGFDEGSLEIGFHDTYLLCRPEHYSRAFPVICDDYGRLYQVQPVHITTDKFKERVENGAQLLRQIYDSGRNIDDIITTGYYDFFIHCGEEYLYFSMTDNTANVSVDTLEVYSSISELQLTEGLLEFDFPTAAESVSLYPIPSAEATGYIPLTVIEAEHITDEAQFPEAGAVKEYMYEATVDDLYWQKQLDSAEDISFTYGIRYDMDGNGSEESIIVLNAVSESGPMFDCNGIYLYDNGAVHNLFWGGNTQPEIELLSGGDKVYLQWSSGAGGTGYDAAVISYTNGAVTQDVNAKRECLIIGMTDGYLLCYPKYAWAVYPVILCQDGELRQLGEDEISREDFISHVDGGEKLLERMTEKGMEPTRIVTAGHLSYWLYYDGINGEENLYFDLINGGGRILKFENYSWCTGYVMTDEILSGGDVFALSER